MKKETRKHTPHIKLNLIPYPFFLTIMSPRLSIDQLLLSKSLTSTRSIVVLTRIESSSKSSHSIFSQKHLYATSFGQCGKCIQLGLDQEYVLL